MLRIFLALGVLLGPSRISEAIVQYNLDCGLVVTLASFLLWSSGG